MASTQEKVAEVVDKKNEEVESSSDEDEHGHDHDHDHDHDHHGHDHPHKAGEKKANKGEKKFKKAMTKFGMKPVPGINRVTIKKSKAFFLYIDDPEVLKSPGADNTYVIFGEAKIQDFSNLTTDEEAKKFSAKQQPVSTEKPTETKAEETKGAEDEEEVSEEGLAPETIEMVMEHTKKSRKEVVKALRATNGDSVTAIINLT